MSDFERAIKELKLGNYSEGMVILQKLLEDDPDNIDILYNLGMCYSEMGLLNKSIELLEKCRLIAPEFTNALVALGFSYHQAGSDEKAMRTSLKALEQEPDNFYALKNLGSLYNKKGDPDNAIKSFNRANTIMPDTPDVMLGLGQAYELKKQYGTADDYYKRAKKSGGADMVVGKAIEGLNRIAIAQMKAEGQGERIDAVMYCLAAIELFSKMSSENVKEISFEIAMLGTAGLSVNDPEKKYTLKSLDGKFSGMQLLCHMVVGLKIIDESLPPVADLESEYRQALKIYRGRLDGH